MYKLIYLVFALLELSQLLMYKPYYDKLQPYFGDENIQCSSIDTDAIALSIVSKDVIKDLKNIEDVFDFSTLNEDHEIFSIKNKKVIGKFKLKTPKKSLD